MHKKITYSVIGLVVGLGLMILALMFLGVDFSEQEQVFITEDDETVTVTYKVPDGGGIDLEALEELFEPKELPEPVVIPLTSDSVSQEYMAAFNALVNDANQLETQMRINVPAAMFEVQKEAEAANYLVMFQNILDAKEVNKVAYSFATNLSVSNNKFRNVVNTEVRSNQIKLSSTALTQDADALVSVSIALLDSLEVALNGSVPDQVLIDKIDEISLELITSAENFADSILSVNKVIQR